MGARKLFWLGLSRALVKLVPHFFSRFRLAEEPLCCGRYVSRNYAGLCLGRLEACMFGLCARAETQPFCSFNIHVPFS